MPKRFARVTNGQPVAEAAVPTLAVLALRKAVIEVCQGGARLVALFARPSTSSGPSTGSGPSAGSGRSGRAGDHRLYAVLADDYEGVLAVAAADLAQANLRYPALTPDLPEAQAFERELHEEHGIEPEGHPWLKPIRREQGYPFYRVDGDEVHEVAVGPVHAGIIEPGHFRFQCHGEEVIHLEIQLGYQRRGAEAILERPGLRPSRAALVAETIAGDSSIAHALAQATALEGLAGIEAPARAQVLRSVALELERLANHTGDLGGLATDIGYLPGAAYFGRLRGAFLNLTEEICGNRYGRSLVRPGGVLFDLDAAQLGAVLKRVERAQAEFRGLAELFFETPSVIARLERTGAVTRAVAEDVGLVGPPARASGCDRDVRHDHPTGAYRFIHLPVALGETGDVYARAMVRRLEAERSLAFLLTELGRLPAGPVRRDCGPPKPASLIVAMTEGWRGETVHAVVTGERGEVVRYKVIDPSFHNWFGLAMALRGEAISDFPLCNKSFNLSYAGHDL